MPRRSILSAAERDGLLAIPEAQDELIRLYTFSDADLALIGQTLRRRQEITLSTFQASYEAAYRPLPGRPG